MDETEAVLICEGAITSDYEQVQEAWQHLIDTGIVWQLQGWYGRTAEQLIEDGICHGVDT